MAGVATILGMLGARVDALQAELQTVRGGATPPTEAESGSDIVKHVVERDFEAYKDQLREDARAAAGDRARLRKDLDEVRSSQATAFKNEKSVIEAVLTQKLERFVNDKITGVSRRVDEVQEALAALTTRTTAIATAVDKQAQFLTELNARIGHLIDAAVARASAKSEGGVHAATTTDETLQSLETSPDLDGAAVATDNTNDEIEMVSTSEKPAARAKPRAKRSTKSSPPPDQASA